MDVIRINKATGEQSIACYGDNKMMMENLVSDIMCCNGQAGQLLIQECRNKVAKTVKMGRFHLMAESRDYDHLIRLNR